MYYKTHLCLLLIIINVLQLVLCEQKFNLESRWPQPTDDASAEAVLSVKQGSQVILKCTSSEKFNLCRWSNPTSEKSCSILGTDSSQKCHSSDRLSIEKSSNGRTCTLSIDGITDDTDEGHWNCNLQSYPKDGQYSSVEAVTIIKIIQPAAVKIDGAAVLPVTEKIEEHFTCEAAGSPKPVRLEWTLDEFPLDIIDRQDESIDTPEIIYRQIVSAFVTADWSGKQLKCTSVQIDDLGQEIRASDVRKLRVVESKMNFNGGQSPGDGGEFKIIDRFPKGQPDEVPPILIAPKTQVTFTCKSTLPWDVCRWKRPNSDEPCGLLSHDISPKSCRQVWTDHATSPGEWIIKKESPTLCSITGNEIDILDVGEWNCNVESKPVASHYLADQEHFELLVISPSRLVANDFPPEKEAVDGQEVQLSITVTEAFPLPKIQWFLNTVPINVVIIKESSVQKNNFGTYSYSLTVGYNVHLEDTGKRIVCKAIQTDDQTMEVVTSLETLLTVKARPPSERTAGLGVGIIAVIVSCAAFLLLALILLFVAFRTGKWCFKQPKTVLYVEKDSPQIEQGHMEAQTEFTDTVDMGVGADFGPGKPRRVDTPDHEYEPLLENDLALKTSNEKVLAADKLYDRYNNDETIKFTYEGSDSLATSLSSLNTEVTEKDWEETFRALGSLLDPPDTNDEDSSSGTEI